VDTNVRVMGLTFENKAVYFFPENVMVQEGSSIRYVDYAAVDVLTATLEVNDMERQSYADAPLIRYGYRFPNKDGTPDKRKKFNPQDVPVYRFGRLSLDLGNAGTVELLVTNPVTPQEFHKTFFARPSVLESPSLAPADDLDTDAAEADEDGEEKQSFKDWVEDVILPGLAVARAVPVPVWVGVFVLAFLILSCGPLPHRLPGRQCRCQCPGKSRWALRRGQARRGGRGVSPTPAAVVGPRWQRGALPAPAH
jgi:hypothetical protein